MNATQNPERHYEGKPESYFGLSRPEMLQFVPPSTCKLLDVGCGSGTFASLVKQERGAQAWGIELFPEAAEQARPLLDHVLVGDALEQMQSIQDQTFDCISFNDVLEHLSDPVSVLLEAKRLLAPEGVVVASLPNIRYVDAMRTLVWRGDFPRENAGIFDRTHLRFFTRTTIRQMFEESGYRIEKMQGLGGPIFYSFRIKFIVKTLQTLFPRRFDDMNFFQYALAARPA